MSHTSTKRRLRQQCFERDGWLEGDTWRAMCAFGCGTELVFNTATLDRYPVMGQHGGKYVLGNVRLACAPCNSINGNHRTTKFKRRQKMLAKLNPEAAQRLLEEKRKQDQAFDYVAPKPQYRKEIKQKLRENYPNSTGLDRNGIRVDDFGPDVIWDNVQKRFRHDT